MNNSEIIINAIVQNFILLAIPTILVFFSTWAKTWLTKRGYQTEIMEAAVRAAGVGYSYIVTNNLRVTDPAAIRQAVEAGTNYLANSAVLGPKLEAVGISPARMGDVVHAELGKLLAHDPSVSAGDATKTQVVNNVVASVETPSESSVKNETKIVGG